MRGSNSLRDVGLLVVSTSCSRENQFLSSTNLKSKLGFRLQLQVPFTGSFLLLPPLYPPLSLLSFPLAFVSYNALYLFPFTCRLSGKNRGEKVLIYTLSKTSLLFFTGRKLRPRGTEIEAPGRKVSQSWVTAALVETTPIRTMNARRWQTDEQTDGQTDRRMPPVAQQLRPGA